MLLRSISVDLYHWLQSHVLSDFGIHVCITTDNDYIHQFMLTFMRNSALLNTHSLAVTFVDVTWLKLTNSATVFCLLRHVSCEQGNIALQRGTFIIIWLGNIHLGWNMWFYVMTKCYARIILKYNNVYCLNHKRTHRWKSLSTQSIFKRIHIEDTIYLHVLHSWAPIVEQLVIYTCNQT